MILNKVINVAVVGISSYFEFDKKRNFEKGFI